MGATLGAQGNPAFTDHFLDELFGPTRDGERLPPGHGEPAEVKTGDRVLMHGLGRAELNGRYAIVLDPWPVRERYHLRLEDTGAEIRARIKHFTKILSAPVAVVDLEAQGVETSTLLHGTCCVCLTEKAQQAVIPCGHLALCDACALRAQGTCPICRRHIFSLLRVYTPGGTGEEELERAIERCRNAEKRASDLEASLEKPLKRIKQDGGPKREGAKASATTPEVGSWIRMPALSARSAQTLLSPEDAEYSQLFGEVVAKDETTYVVRFRGVDEQTFLETGRKQPGCNYKDVQLPLELSFQCVYSTQDAEWTIAAQDRYCVFASMKASRQKKLRTERRAEEKKLRSRSVLDVL